MLGSTAEDPDRVDPAEALMREVGAQLRRARLERDEDLDEVAEYLRIKSAYLFGIEQGDLSPMPGRTYALGFLRSYADYLGFDGEDLIAQIKSTVEDLTDRTRFRIRSPLPESRLPKMPIVVLSLAMVAGIYTGWSYLNRSSQMMIETVSQVPGNLRSLALEALPEDPAETPPAAAEDAPAVAEADRAATAPVATAPEIAPGTPPRGSDPATADLGAADEVADPGAAALGEAPGSVLTDRRGDPPPATPEGVLDPFEPQAGPEVEAAVELADTLEQAAGLGAGPVFAAPGTTAPPGLAAEARRPSSGELGSAAAVAPAGEVLARFLDPTALATEGAPQIHEMVNGDARVILRAREVSWIQVSSASGDYLRALTLGPEEAFLVPNRPDLELWTGNAGGLEVIVDGTPVAPLGTPGQVVRQVSLDPDRLRAGPSPGAGDAPR